MIRILFLFFVLGVFQKQEAFLVEKERNSPCPISRAVSPEEAAEWENRVYLASYDSSGQGWILNLIQEATGILTSSVCPRDRYPPPMMPGPWGGYYRRSKQGVFRMPVKEMPFVVSTHYPSLPKNPFDGLPCLLTVRLIRNPVDSFSSYCLAMKSSRFSHVNKELRTMQSFGAWNRSERSVKVISLTERVKKYSETWLKFHSYWDLAQNVLTIRHEDLCKDPHTYLQLILENMGYTVSEEDINRAVAKYPPIFRTSENLSLFTEEELTIFQEELGDFMCKYAYELRNMHVAL